MPDAELEADLSGDIADHRGQQQREHHHAVACQIAWSKSRLTASLRASRAASALRCGRSMRDSIRLNGLRSTGRENSPQMSAPTMRLRALLDLIAGIGARN